MKEKVTSFTNVAI